MCMYSNTCMNNSSVYINKNNLEQNVKEHRIVNLIMILSFGMYTCHYLIKLSINEKFFIALIKGVASCNISQLQQRHTTHYRDNVHWDRSVASNKYILFVVLKNLWLTWGSLTIIYENMEYFVAVYMTFRCMQTHQEYDYFSL